MITGREIAVGVIASWRLALRDQSALSWFDVSEHGMWRSFYAALPTFPMFILLRLMTPPPPGVEVGTARYFAVYSIEYVIGWVIFPLAMVTLTEIFDREERLFTFITVNNWATILQVGLLLLFGVLSAGGVLTGTFGSLAMIGALAAVLWYKWYIASVALDITGVQAGVVVMLDLFLGLILTGIASGLL